jgi:XTP/dITP diphosphohydrolase
MTLYCATTNAGKLREFRLAIESLSQGRWSVEPVAGMRDILPFEETGDTFETNAAGKALYYSLHAPGPLFADDSGLEVHALGGVPGVYSARYSGPHATDESNNRLLLERLQGVEDRAAQFVSVVALAERGRLIRTFRGVVEGRIIDQARGRDGFGYDPLFYYPPFDSTFGEIPGERKQSVSHRGRALAAMMEYLASGSYQA